MERNLGNIEINDYEIRGSGRKRSGGIKMGSPYPKRQPRSCFEPRRGRVHRADAQAFWCGGVGDLEGSFESIG